MHRCFDLVDKAPDTGGSSLKCFVIGFGHVSNIQTNSY